MKKFVLSFGLILKFSKCHRKVKYCKSLVATFRVYFNSCKDLLFCKNKVTHTSSVQFFSPKYSILSTVHFKLSNERQSALIILEVLWCQENFTFKLQFFETQQKTYMLSFNQTHLPVLNKVQASKSKTLHHFILFYELCPNELT